ncbi:MAG: response regulator [bacterium]
MNILAIDDNTELLAAVADMLVRHAHTVDCADSADKALELVRAKHYDVVLVDYWMPVHNGMWFIKNASLPRNTKVLLVTSYVDMEVVKKMFDEGIAGYVAKPFDETELLLHLKFHESNHIEKQISPGR